MNTRLKDLFIGLLALTTLGAGSLAWHQHSKLLELQATASLASTEREQWQQRVREAEQRSSAFDSEFVTLMGGEEVGAPEGARGPESNAARGGFVRGGDNDGPNRGQRNEQLTALMQSPEFIRLRATQQKAALDARYADLFRSLNADPATIDRFKDLLVDRQNAVADVFAATQEQGLNPRENREVLRQLVQDTQAEIDAAILATLGQTGYEQYKFHEQTEPQRNLVGQLQTALSYSSAPLQQSQADQLVQILATASPRRNASIQTAAGGFMVGRGGPNATSGASVTITNEIINQAQGILAPAQVSALQELQAQQQAQQQLHESLREITGGNRGGGNRGGPATTPAGGSRP